MSYSHFDDNKEKNVKEQKALDIMTSILSCSRLCNALQVITFLQSQMFLGKRNENHSTSLPNPSILDGGSLWVIFPSETNDKITLTPNNNNQCKCKHQERGKNVFLREHVDLRIFIRQFVSMAARHIKRDDNKTRYRVKLYVCSNE